MSLNFLDDAVFLSAMGLKAIGKRSLAYERCIEHRSSLVDGRLVNEKGLENGQLACWRGYLLCLVNGRIYLADSRQQYVQASTGNTEYEWYFWDNIGVYDDHGAFCPANTLYVYKDQLYFGADGALCTFNTDWIKDDSGELQAAAYLDDGPAETREKGQQKRRRFGTEKHDKRRGEGQGAHKPRAVEGICAHRRRLF